MTFWRNVLPNMLLHGQNAVLVVSTSPQNFYQCTLCPESSENIPILFQGADLYFSNQNDLRNPKMGSKQSISDPTEWSFLQITFFGTKNHQKIDIFEL